MLILKKSSILHSAALWPQVKTYQLEAEEVFPNYAETVTQMVIPNLSRKLKALLVTPKRNITEAGKQLVDSIVMKRKPGKLNYLLSLKHLLHFVENSNSVPAILELHLLIKQAIKLDKHRVQPGKLIALLVGKTKRTKDTSSVIRILTEIRMVMMKVGKKFQARVSVGEFTQLLQRIEKPKLMPKMAAPDLIQKVDAPKLLPKFAAPKSSKIETPTKLLKNENLKKSQKNIKTTMKQVAV